MNKNLHIPIFVGLITIGLSINACKKEESPESLTPNNQTQFKNQIMQGKINGAIWVMVSGRAKMSSFDSTKYSVEFYDIQDTTNCGFFSPSGNYVFGSIPKQTGKYSMSGFNNGQASITILYRPSYMNYISEGTIEITKMDTSSKTIEGRISIPGEADYNMNGNFSLKICD